VLYRGQKEALAEFLPLNAENWITCGNALRLDWLSICPPTGTGVKHHADDLFYTPLDQAQIGFENAGGETYICGNPPYYGSRKQSAEQKLDLAQLCGTKIRKWRSPGLYCRLVLEGTRIYSRSVSYICFNLLESRSLLLVFRILALRSRKESLMAIR